VGERGKGTTKYYDNIDIETPCGHRRHLPTLGALLPICSGIYISFHLAIMFLPRKEGRREKSTVSLVLLLLHSNKNG